MCFIFYTFTVNVIHFHRKISEVYHENLFFLMRKSQRTSQHRTIQNVKTHNRTTQKTKKMRNMDSLYVYVLWHGGVSHLTMTFDYKVIKLILCCTTFIFCISPWYSWNIALSTKIQIHILYVYVLEHDSVTYKNKVTMALTFHLKVK